MRTLALGAVLVLAAASRVGAQPNRCVECHFANFSHVPAAQELARWDGSPHAAHGVTCDRCHGGDPTTYQPQDAHRGVLDGRNPLSSVNRRNIALTCAGCHAGVVAAFKASGHAAGARADAVPDCTTCHGPMASRTPSASVFEMTCAGCHAGSAARADYPMLARVRLDAVRAIEQTLVRLETAIPNIEDRQKRNRLAAELRLARAALKNATDAIHTFDVRAMDKERAAAQRRAVELTTALVDAR